MAKQQRLNALLQIGSPPYPPSWLDRTNAWVERLPIPGFVFYFLFYLFVIFIQDAVGLLFGRQWQEQELSRKFLYQLFTLEALYYNYISHGLVIEALANFQSMLSTSKKKVEQFTYELAILPAGKTLVLTIIAIVASVGLAFISPSLFRTPVELSFGYVLYETLGWVFSLFGAFILVYRLLHQIRRVIKIYQTVKVIDLYNLGPIYSLSSFMAKASLILLFILYSNLFADPANLEITGFLPGSAAISVVALVGFVWPLVGINRRLVTKKADLLRDSGNQVKAAFERLDNQAAAKNPRDIGNIRQLLDAVIKKREFIQSIPTWPWQPGTFRNLLLGIFLPMVIWLIQQILLRTVVN